MLRTKYNLVQCAMSFRYAILMRHALSQQQKQTDVYSTVHSVACHHSFANGIRSAAVRLRVLFES